MSLVTTIALCPTTTIAQNPDTLVIEDYAPGFIFEKPNQTAEEAIKEYGAQRMVKEHNRLLAENKMMKEIIVNNLPSILHETIHTLFALIKEDSSVLARFQKHIRNSKDPNALEIVKILGTELDIVPDSKKNDKKLAISAEVQQKLNRSFMNLNFLIDLMNKELPIDKRINFQELVKASHAHVIGLPSNFSTARFVWKGVCITGKVLYVTYNEVIKLATFLGVIPTALVSIAILLTFMA